MYIIVGAGGMGVELAERMSKTGHEIVVIEIDEDRANIVRRELDVPLVIRGDGSDPDVLKDAGIEKADSLVAVTSDDETNLMVCRVAKDVGSCRVVARVEKDEYAEIFKEVGADVVVSSISATMGLIEKAAVSSGLYGMISMGGENGDVVEVRVSEGSKAEGKAIKDLNFSELCTVGLIRRKGELIPPRGTTVFQKDDRVILVGKSNEVILAVKLFQKE